MSMQDPKYKLGQTVRHKFGSGEAVSRIKSVVTQRDRWLYVVANPNGGKAIYIPEEDIIKEI